MKTPKTHDEYLALSDAERKAFDDAREAQKAKWKSDAIAEEAEKQKAIDAYEAREAKKEAAFKATGNRDVFGIDAPTGVYSNDELQKYLARVAVVEKLLA
jgi:hypothetical protein